MSAWQRKARALSNAVKRTDLDAAGHFLTSEPTEGLSCSWVLVIVCCLVSFLRLGSLYSSFLVTMVFDGEGGMASLWGSCRNVGLFHLGAWLTLTVFLHSSVSENAQMSWGHIIGVTLSGSQHSTQTHHSFTRQTCRVSVYQAHRWIWTWVWVGSRGEEVPRTCFKAFTARVDILVKIACIFLTENADSLSASHLYWIKISMCFLGSDVSWFVWCVPDCC